MNLIESHRIGSTNFIAYSTRVSIIVFLLGWLTQPFHQQYSVLVDQHHHKTAQLVYRSSLLTIYSLWSSGAGVGLKRERSKDSVVAGDTRIECELTQPNTRIWLSHQKNEIKPSNTRLTPLLTIILFLDVIQCKSSFLCAPAR